MPGQKAVDLAREILPPTEYELGEYESRPGIPRYDTLLRFKTIGPVKAGWMTKGRAGWQITEEGLEALDKFSDPDTLAIEAHAGYRRWKADQPENDPEETDDDTSETLSVTIERAEEIAWGEIEAFLRNMQPYDFQDLVSALSRQWVTTSLTAPRQRWRSGHRCLHRLRCHGPRIKVQVKRHNSGSVGAPDLRSFLAVLGQQDVGIFVATNGFTSDAHKEARAQESRRIMLIDLDRLVSLWVENYSKLDDEAQAMFPIRPVYFLHH